MKTIYGSIATVKATSVDNNKITFLFPAKKILIVT